MYELSLVLVPKKRRSGFLVTL